MPLRARVRTLALVACSAGSLSLACSSNGSGTAQGEDPTAAPEKYLGLEVPKEEEGFLVKSEGMDIPPGQDLEFCEVAELPGEVEDEYWVSSLEFGNGESSHHLIVDVAKDGGAAAAKLAELEVGDIVPCISSQSAFGDGFEFIGGSQQPYKEVAYPDGVGRKFHGKQRFVFDYHYLNTSEETVHAKSAVSFHLTRASEVKYIANIFSFSNMTIDTPAGKRASFVGECKVNSDIKLTELTRHTHRWGTDYKVWFAGGESDGELVFQSPDYEHDLDYFFDPVVDVKAGEGFRFQCDYENTENHSLRFGPNATDEMCILFGLWWSETEASPEPQDCLMTQIGSDGVARPAEEGSFPAPTEEQVAACKAASPATGPSTECSDCRCETCGAVIDACTKDADCGAILDCITTSGCGSQAECISACQDAINEHSPGTGPLIQLSQCVSSSCAMCSSRG